MTLGSQKKNQKSGVLFSSARPLRVLNLGAGVQSSAILLMSIRGELPVLDCAIFADTGWEPSTVYRHLEWMTAEAAKVGMPVHVVKAGNLREDVLFAQVNGKATEGHRFASMPLRVVNQDGSLGMVRRQCTTEYKIKPIEAYIKKMLGLGTRQHWPTDAVVEQWFGISKDEAHRAKAPRRADGKPASWRRHVYPLMDLVIEPGGQWSDRTMTGSMTRNDCLRWLDAAYPDRQVPRSACLGCPFHSDKEWRDIKGRPADWCDVLEVDQKIRNSEGMRGQMYLHQSGNPLGQVDLRNDFDRGQGNLFANECDGMCGV